MKIRKKDALGIGIVIGATSGLLIGYVLGSEVFFPPEPYDPNGFNFDFSAAYAGISAGVGAVLGGIIGGAIVKQKTYKISGDQAAFYQVKEKLRQHQLLADGKP